MSERKEAHSKSNFIPSLPFSLHPPTLCTGFVTVSLDSFIAFALQTNTISCVILISFVHLSILSF